MTEYLKHCIPQGHGLPQEYIYINTLHKGDNDDDDNVNDDNKTPKNNAI